MRIFSGWLRLGALALLIPTGAAGLCAGDCDHDQQVSVADVVAGVICLLQGATCVGCCDDCLDVNENGVVAINEIIAVINSALNGCPTFRLLVRVQRIPGQNSHARGGFLELRPLGRYAFLRGTDVDQALFRFENVPPGNYSLTYSYGLFNDELVLCNPFGCWAKDNPVSIVDADVYTVIPIHVPCQEGADCADTGGERCVEPGGFAGCGICQDVDDQCTVDADCGDSGLVCISQPQPPCPCDGTPALVCAAACGSEADCRSGERCAADGHCRPHACITDDDCPAYFSCADAEGNPATSCSRRRCTADPDCGDGGFCVLSRCYYERGSCQAIPP